MRMRMIDQETLNHFRRQAEKAVDRMRHIRREDCPSCDGVASDIGSKCTSRGDPDTEEHGFGDGPMCKWALSERSKETEANVTRERSDRMRRAGIMDKALVEWMAPLRSYPTPPFSWFGPQQEQREGVFGLMADADGFLSAQECRCFIMFGGTGAGKTTAAAWIVAGEKDNALWLPARTADDLDRWKAVSSQAYSIGLLVIDDLGTERESSSGWASEALSSLWTHRLDAGMRTVVTTNLTPQQLVDRYGGDRLRSRLTQRPLVGHTLVGNVDLRRLKRDYEQRMGQARDFRGER